MQKQWITYGICSELPAKGCSPPNARPLTVLRVELMLMIRMTMMMT